MRPFHQFCLLVALLFLGGCVTPPPPKPKPPVPQPQAKSSYWQGDGATGEPSILIDLSEQRAHFFKGQTEVGQALISSGKKGFETPTGEFKVTQRNQKHASNLYGDFVDETGSVVQRNVDVKKHKAPEGASFRGAKMPYFLRFQGATGMHAGRLPGYRASHGCVRLPGFMAKHFFENAPLGTPVRVIGGGSASGSASSPAKKTAKPAKPAPPTEPAAPAKPSEPATPDKPPAQPAEVAPPTPAPEGAEKQPAPADPPAAPSGA